MKHLRILMIAAVATLFCSCQKEDVDGQRTQTEEAIKFNISITPPPSSRVNNDDLNLQKTYFEEGDQIGIWIMRRPIYQSEPEPPIKENNNVRLENYIIVFKDGEWGFFYPNDLTKNIQLLRQPGYRFDYYAYYPAQAGTMDNIDPMNLVYSARSNKKIKHNDFMAAVNTDCPDGTTVVDLNFKHLVSMFEVRQPGLGNNASVKLVSPKIISTGAANFSKSLDDPDFFTTHTQFDADADIASSVDFTAYGNGRYRLWLPAQSLPAGDDTYLEICSDKSNKTNENTIAYYLQPTNDQGEIEFVQGQSRYLEEMPKFSPELYSTPNSIVHTSKRGQTKTLPVAKVYAMWLNDPVLKATNPNLYGELALKQLWADTPDFEEAYEVTLSNANAGASATLRVSPKTGGSQLLYEGNAVYGLYIGDTLRWSWHIWGTTRINPLENTYQHNGQTFMNCNLGAWPSKLVGSEGGVRGLLYQYGRKDPFPGASYDGWDFTKYQAVYDTSGLINAELPYGVYINTSARTSNVDSMTINPVAFHTGWNPTGSMALWNTDPDASKSPYDPCPQGWRIGVDPEQSVWYNGGSSDLADYTEYPWDNGLTFLDPSYRIGYYPQTNYRLATGELSQQSSIAMWHGGRSGNTFSVDEQSSVVNTNAESAKALGQTVRCVKDDNDLEIWNVFTYPDYVIWTSFGDQLKGKVKR